MSFFLSPEYGSGFPSTGPLLWYSIIYNITIYQYRWDIPPTAGLAKTKTVIAKKSSHFYLSCCSWTWSTNQKIFSPLVGYPVNLHSSWSSAEVVLTTYRTESKYVHGEWTGEDVTMMHFENNIVRWQYKINFNFGFDYFGFNHQNEFFLLFLRYILCIWVQRGQAKPNSLYVISRAVSIFYGIEIEIWAGFGIVSSSKKNWADYEQLLREVFYVFIVSSTLKSCIISLSIKVFNIFWIFFWFKRGCRNIINYVLLYVTVRLMHNDFGQSAKIVIGWNCYIVIKLRKNISVFTRHGLRRCVRTRTCAMCGRTCACEKTSKISVQCACVRALLSWSHTTHMRPHLTTLIFEVDTRRPHFFSLSWEVN